MNDINPDRHKVWVAMSDLFLDTDVSVHFSTIEQVLALSSYSEAELAQILRDEVAPICLPNLSDIAGEWAGFQEDRLIAAIETYLSRPAWLRRIAQGRRARQLAKLVPEWPAILERVSAARSK